MACRRAPPPKRSEYRNNYLPFDYYDFWITAKENKSLCYRNKIRDYLHTPFDWDEEQDWPSSAMAPVPFVDHNNQATQTADAHRNNNNNNNNNSKKPHAHQNHHHHHRHHHSHHSHHHQQQQHSDQSDESDQNGTDCRQHHHQHHQMHKIAAAAVNGKKSTAAGSGSCCQQQTENSKDKNNVSPPPPPSHQKPILKKKKQQQSQHISQTAQPAFARNANVVGGARPTKSAAVQTSPHLAVSRPRARSCSNKKRPATASALTTKQQCEHVNSRARTLLHKFETEQNVSNFDKVLARSISNMAVQTPPAWTLRAYDSAGKPTSANANRKAVRVRSSSVTNLRVKKPPFANYGWAVKTKDLSVKPTRNALALKNMADLHHDRDAIIELTLNKLKKEATAVANEFSATAGGENSTAAAMGCGGGGGGGGGGNNSERYSRVRRSDSRGWTSEYEERYPDYTCSRHNRELYYAPHNPNRLSKSAFVSCDEPTATAWRRTCCT